MMEGVSVLVWLQFNLKIFYYEACGSAPMIVARCFGLDSLRFSEGFITALTVSSGKTVLSATPGFFL